MIGFITGASRGLGYELVKEGLLRGHTMIAACRKGLKGEGSRDLLRLKEQYGDRLLVLSMDVTDEEEIKRAALAVRLQYGYIDFLVNNAGVLFEKMKMPGDAIEDLDIERFRETLEVNVTGQALVLKYLIGLIYASGDACIMNISSEAGHLSPYGYNYLAYSVSKHALNMYTQKIRNYLAEEKADKHIRVYMVHPGRMDTVMGKENAQIPPSLPAIGILDILERKTKVPDMEVPFINYKGELMPY
ncbi:SDR family NAD(P)-dependent oxidoreductase [Lacrimispora sp.]|uniref:SDR family NAD(P)-dependent oxidoreductase n=1 Tax=Lacrimispora sp. TaxID=2719234 RepID=UPI0028A8D01A|nr:SDR family NAD(P)-dependent oxidoreductase [Lacrimispora sp.]